MSNLTVQAVDLVSTIRTAPLKGAPSSQDYNDSQRECLQDLASLTEVLNDVILPLLRTLNATDSLGDANVLNGDTVFASSSSDNPLFLNSTDQSPLLVSDVLARLNATIQGQQTTITSLNAKVVALATQVSSSNQNDIAKAIQGYADQLNRFYAQVNSLQIAEQGDAAAIARMQTDVTSTKAAITTLQTDDTAAKAAITSLQADVSTLKTTVANLPAGGGGGGGGGTGVGSGLIGSGSLTNSAILDGTVAVVGSLPLAGVATTDVVVVSAPFGAGIYVTGRVLSAGQVTIEVLNVSGATVTSGSQTYQLRAITLAKVSSGGQSLSTSVSLSNSAIVDGAWATIGTATLTGVVTTDVVVVSAPFPSGVYVSGRVTGAGQVAIDVLNLSGSTLASGSHTYQLRGI